MRFFLFLIFALSVAGYFTNPTEADLRGVLEPMVASKVESEMKNLPDSPKMPSAPQLPGLPGVPTPALPQTGTLKEDLKRQIVARIMTEIKIERQNYYVFSMFRLQVPEVPGQPKPPGCVFGAFKMGFIPLTSC